MRADPRVARLAIEAAKAMLPKAAAPVAGPRKRADVPMLAEVEPGHGSGCTCEICWRLRREMRENRALSVEEKRGGGVKLSSAEKLAALRERFPT